MAAPVPVLDQFGEWRSFSPGLDRVREVLVRMGMPHRRYRHFLIGGTNGKGTVSNSLAHQLPGSVGLFISPHLIDVRERITVGGRFIADHHWQEAFRRIEAVRGDIPLSYFEWVFVLAVQIFADLKVDSAVFEVGLGGRLDATNCLDPDLSVVTSIGLDHMAILGNSLEAIALEKIAIARPGKPLVLSESVYQLPGVAEALIAIAPRLEIVPDVIGFHGNLRILNRALFCTGLPETDRLKLLPGRRAFFPIAAGVFVDGAHNEPAWLDLRDYLQERGMEDVHLLCGLSEGRDPRQFLDLMTPLCSRVRVWRVGFEKELPVEAWPQEVSFVDEPVLSEDQVNVVCGSLYLVGAFYRYFQLPVFPQPE